MEPPVWLCPDHTVRMALVTMKGFLTGTLAVVEGGAYLGIVHWSDLIDLEPDTPLLKVMKKGGAYLAPTDSIADAAALIMETKADRIAVVDEGRLVGWVSPHNLMPELGRSKDPLTGLSWSDSLREWALDRLRGGQEISILFFDLDQFGLFNKKFGHRVGDRVLEAVADTLRQVIDSDSDVLCRYGGDEFAIGTIRGNEASEAFAEEAAREIESLDPPADDGRIEVSWGVKGGKRTKERDDVHFAATLDNLINLASKQAQAMKEGKRGAVVQDQPVETTGGVGLRSVNVSAEGNAATVSVELTVGSTLVTASLNGPATDGMLERLVAQTVADAISHALPKGTSLMVHDSRLSTTADGETFASVQATLYTPSQMKELTGTFRSNGDTNRAVAMALIQASEEDVMQHLSP